MTRPTALDMDLVVVPREATERELRDIAAAARDFTTMPGLYQRAQAIRKAMLSASPYHTAWDDVRNYVEGLERSFAACEADRLERIEQCDRMADDWAVFCTSIGVTWDTHEAVACEIEARAEAAEARIAELEKRLADAERVIEPFARLGTMSTHSINEDCTISFSFFRTADMSAFTDARRAARAYMVGK